MQADYVIVGAGSAGCVLANRLSRDPGTRVMLIEAGGRDRNPLIHIPAGYIKLLDHPSLTWGFKAEPDPGVNGRAILYPRGRVLGGSSSINGMIYVRGQPEDFDHWGQLGNRGWSWDDVLPYFKRAEDWEDGADEFHGAGGPLLTSRSADKPALVPARSSRPAPRSASNIIEDVNHLPPGAGDNIGWVQQTRRGRRRQSAARTYLRPALKRQNLTVVTDALVHRVVLDGKRAVAVEFSRGGPVERVDAPARSSSPAAPSARRMCCNCRGSATPSISGKIGVAVNHALPGVGKNLQDHFLARVTAEVTGIGTANEKSRGMPFVGEVHALCLRRQRIADLCRLAGLRVGQGTGGIRNARRADPVRQCELRAGPDPPARRPSRDDRRHVADAALVARLCRGEIGRPAHGPGDQPALPQRGHRPARRDRRVARGAPAVPRSGARSPISLAKSCRAPRSSATTNCSTTRGRHGSTVFHATCTCKMGRDAMAVVDDRLRVHGLQGLRVIDASVMPTVTSTNTNAPTIMIAEKGAAMILARRGSDWRRNLDVIPRSGRATSAADREPGLRRDA